MYLHLIFNWTPTPTTTEERATITQVIITGICTTGTTKKKEKINIAYDVTAVTLGHNHAKSNVS